MSCFRLPPTALCSLPLLAVLALLGACAPPIVQTGQPRDAVLQSWGAPTARYSMDGGAERLEYASGPYGRTTWMIDIDAGGHVRQARQVLGDAHFAEFQARAPGLTREQLLRELGRPGERQHGGLRGGETWSWRYPTNDCLWFQVSLGADATVSASGYGIDPVCDAASDRN